MHGIQIVYWALSILFCMAMGFAILLWCREWRREERAETARQIKALASEIGRLAQVVDAFEHTSSSLQAADELLTRQVENLRRAAKRLQVTPSPPAPEATRPALSSPMPAEPSPPEPDAETDRYSQARALLRDGQTPVDIARILDIGTAEVRMIARVMARGKESGEPQGGE